MGERRRRKGGGGGESSQFIMFQVCTFAGKEKEEEDPKVFPCCLGWNDKGRGERPSSFASGKNFWLSWLKKPFYRFVRFSRARKRYNDRTGSGGKTLVFDRLFHAFSKLQVSLSAKSLKI